MKSRSPALAAMLLCCFVACSDDDPLPTEPEIVVEVETFTVVFTGEVLQGGLTTHFFTLAVDGSASIAMLEVAPLSSLTVGLEIGTSVDGGCTVFGSDNSVQQGEVFLSDELLAGDYCVSIFDVGNIFPEQVVSYVVEVTHT